MFLRRLIVPALALSITAALTSAPAPVRASECTRDVTVNVEESLPMARVEAIARTQWQREVTKLYGVSFSSWRHARGAATRCVRTETRAGDSQPFLCFARGTPCKAGG